MNWKERKIIYIALLISLILHLLGLILFTGFNLFAFTDENKPQEPEPLELVFERPESPEMPETQLPDKFYEIVENPNASGESPIETDMLSTASSISQAPVIIPGQIRAVPGSESTGDQQSETSEEQKSDDELQEAYQKSLMAYRENRSFSRSALTGETPQTEDQKKIEKSQVEGETSRTPEGFDAESVGDFALSTYEWDWAPYWLDFKRKLNRVWYAPPAYYQLGLIHGYTIVRFKITRDGRIYDFEVLKQVGHSSLQQSSVNAIEAVFPFKELPNSFPDEYLEVTIKMIYPNLRAYNISQRR
jgi:outer membrane biosynthesis protein TonB